MGKGGEERGRKGKEGIMEQHEGKRIEKFRR